MGSWNHITSDLASAGKGGWRAHRADGGGALLLEAGYVLDASLEDAIVTLPSARDNWGRIVWAKRVDAPSSMFVAELVPFDTSETIQGDASYSLVSQWASVVLIAQTDGTWLVQSEIL